MKSKKVILFIVIAGLSILFSLFMELGMMPEFLAQVYYWDFISSIYIGIFSINVLVVCLGGMLSSLRYEEEKYHFISKYGYILAWLYPSLKVLCTIVMNYITDLKVVDFVYGIFENLFVWSGTLAVCLGFSSIVLMKPNKGHKLDTYKIILLVLIGLLGLLWILNFYFSFINFNMSFTFYLN